MTLPFESADRLYLFGARLAFLIQLETRTIQITSKTSIINIAKGVPKRSCKRRSNNSLINPLILKDPLMFLYVREKN